MPTAPTSPTSATSALEAYLNKSKRDLSDVNIGFLAYLANLDCVSRVSPESVHAVLDELRSQRSNVKLTASENYTSLGNAIRHGEPVHGTNTPKVFRERDFIPAARASTKSNRMRAASRKNCSAPTTPTYSLTAELMRTWLRFGPS